jgi:hypothetical protein
VYSGTNSTIGINFFDYDGMKLDHFEMKMQIVC